MPSGAPRGLSEAGRDQLPTDDVGSDGMRIHSPDQTSDTERPIASSPYDGLSVEEDLRELGRTLTADDEGEESPSISSQQRLRLDGLHATPADWRTTSSEDQFSCSPGSSSHGDSVISKVPWAVLSLGVAAFVCGGVLMTWSFVAQRPELWRTGIPVLLVGQIGLLVGLILQLDRLWHENRHTTRVDRLDHRLHESIASRRSPTEQSSANQILADLRGQLDLLSDRLSQEDR